MKSPSKTVDKTPAERTEGVRVRSGALAHSAHPGDFHGLQQNAGNLAVERLFRMGVIQAKLSISRPGDPDELEADRIAAEISHREGAAPKCAACASAGSTCPKCEEEGRIQRSARGDGGGSSQLPGVRGLGEPLATSTRTFFESTFGVGFGHVRVHTGDQANQAADSIGARAFTLGSDVVFAGGQFAPDTPEGEKLLAHELTHVVQQSRGGPRRVMRDVNPQAKPEQEAPFNSLVPRETVCYAPVGPTITFEGVLLAGNTAYVQSVLREYFEKHGEKETKDFVSRFMAHVAGQVRDAENLNTIETLKAIRNLDQHPAFQVEAKILRAVNDALDAVLARNQKFIADFEAKANEVVLGMLDESEARVREEMIRYGVDWSVRSYDISVPDDLPSQTHIRGSVTDYSMKDSPASRALGEAAKGLLKRKKTYDKAREEMADEYPEVAQWAVEISAQRGRKFEDIEKYNRLKEARDHAKRDLDVFRIQKTAEFPILGAYASDEEISEGSLGFLQQLAEGSANPATGMIGAEIKSRLQHINEVRTDITENHGKETKIWRVPRIINGTRAALGLKPGSMYDQLIDEKVKDEAPGIWTSILIGLLQLVLVLLAPVTGGATLIPAAAISVGQAYAHFREYERAQMLRGTDFGAMALSAEDPSLFWLALDIVGAGFDVGAAAGAAVSIFRALGPAARAARATRAVEDVAKLERAAAELGGEAFGKAVAHDAVDVSEAVRVGETAEEARSIERAGEQMAEVELKSGFAEAGSTPGRTVKVSENGSIWSCASPCTWLRERYKGLLRRKGENWNQRLEALENEAAGIPKGKAGELKRQELANKAAELEREMRTKAMPGEWTSPLRDTKGVRTSKSVESYQEIVTRRGSVAAELDHHPPDWIGKDEALFRYGEKAEAEEGYRWVLDENGKLRYEPMRADLPTREFNPTTGEFQVASQKGLIEALPQLRETRDFAKLPKKQQEAIKAAFKKRKSLIASRDRLEALAKLSDEDAEALSKIYGQINEQSRQIGENAAEAIMKSKGGNKIYPRGKTYSTSGDFDQIWEINGEYHIIEAKGGKSPLGSRALSTGERAEQGTQAYALEIAKNMANNGATKEIRQLGNKLVAAITKQKYKYLLVQAPIGEDIGETVVKVSEFLLVTK
jgi:hypothetical protein